MSEKIRIDKWLWHARFYKTRSLASDICKAGKIRLNGGHVKKASQMVGPQDILTFTKGNKLFVVEIAACGDRRGPAPEAQALYVDMSPPQEAADSPEKAAKETPSRPKGEGRPTKKDRRAYNKLTDF